MVSRRWFLVSGGVFAGAAFGSCINEQNTDGVTSTFRDNPPFSIPDNDYIVSRQPIESTNKAGAIRGTVTAYDDPESENITVICDYRVSSQPQEWEHTDLHEIHDWSHLDKEMLTWGSNLVPAAREDHLASVENRSASYEANWNVHLAPPRTAPTHYLFRSVYPVEDLTDGDVIAEIRTEVKHFEVTDWFPDDISIEIHTPLVYDDIETQ